MIFNLKGEHGGADDLESDEKVATGASNSVTMPWFRPICTLCNSFHKKKKILYSLLTQKSISWGAHEKLLVLI